MHSWLRWRLVTVKTREPMQRQKVQLSPIIHQPFPLFMITEYLLMELLIEHYGGDGGATRPDSLLNIDVSIHCQQHCEDDVRINTAMGSNCSLTILSA